ncbi:DUF805 domain-containing protein [Pleionea litopenaei]|uniref:DUF805 domain-containing protein n=1 Tax=Pleionea litopenaei TaxID=3070815 RepID=A0AA51RQQ3_9GAMM|nr:DUF805 domain-containing protein [Pleionea sp. HL-JVS1]WMS85851.1 DUF805 domain-containing protein [Pleionea sp. HL-JVS1]
MSQATTYDVLLTGQLNADREQVVAELAKLFKKTVEQVEQLLEKAPVVIKKQQEADKAHLYQKRLQAIGAVVELKENKVPLHEQWSLESTETEHKRTGRAEFASRDVEPESASSVVPSPVPSAGAPEASEDVYATPASSEVQRDYSSGLTMKMSLGAIYFSFKGRINRKTFWLLYVLPMLLAGVIIGVVTFFNIFAGVILAAIGAIPYIWISFAVAFKRLHDVNMSGWWYGGLSLASFAFGAISAFNPTFASFQFLFSIAGFAIFIINGFIAGTQGENRYGYPQE